MVAIRLTSGIEFSSEAGVSILDAASKAKVTLPYSCKTGRCSSCKCKVLAGSTIALQPELGLTNEEKAQGWVLGCVRSAQSDVTLEVDDLGAWSLPPAKTLPCRIDSLRRLANDVMEVKLRLPPTAEFDYLPGQYIDVIGPQGVRRSYSLASATPANKMLELHVRAVGGGVMSAYWFERARPNDLLRLNGPLGTFFLRDAVGVELTFLATGTGIAPVKAILESIAGQPADQQPKSVTVVWGGRQQADLYLDISSIAGSFTYIPVLSRAPASWTSATGYVQDILLARAPDLSSAAVYACGSDAMIHSAEARLVEAGLPATRFYSDAFVRSGTH
ncbi:FAD-binding oxidoreductase [Rhodoferax sp.]|jgi:CDP-4-dehydro-6-deoxyglucose reductase|uniref:FAD-binding oxidoreductase n=1 Tax=Rhodoferax sp. TaxID=50421 RepID=UPI003783B83C